MEVKELAEMMQRAGHIREGSWDAARSKYNHDYHTACELAGMPKVWADLLAPYMSLGYCDTWEWVEQVLGKKEE